MSPSNPHRFPQAYVEALHQFAERGYVRIGPMTAAGARSSRARLYQFKRNLWDVYRADPIAADLYDIIQRAIIRITDGPDGVKYVTLETDPIVAAFSQPTVDTENC